MLRKSSKNINSNFLTRQKLFSASNSVVTSRVLPVQTFRKHKKPEVTENKEETRTFKRRYVEVDSLLAKTNKYTYVMPGNPYVASERVTKILEIGAVDDAADYIKALPLYLQSTVVWNQIIGYCAKLGKSNHAEHYYSQMRKRGLKPNERTFTHFLTAYSQSNSPQAIENAETWLKLMKDFNIEPAIIHMNNLMRVYNNADQPEKTIKTLKQMSTTGNLSPDAVTYTTALLGCVNLNQMDRAKEVRNIWQEIIHHVERNQKLFTSSSLLSKKASEIIWKEDAIRTNTKDAELKVDDFLVVALLSAVTRTAVSEKDVVTGVEALDRLYSLCPPRAAEMMQRNDIQHKSGFGFQPSPRVLDAILRFSGGLREFKLGAQYFHLALQQFPQLEPDRFVYDAFSCIEKQLKRSNNHQKKRQYQTR